VIAVLDSACASVDGSSDIVLNDIVKGKASGVYGLFVNWVGIELLEN